MFRLAATLATLAAAKELVNANFDAEVFDSGKNSIVKFQAPWWGHCKSMKPAYDQLATKYADSASVGIFDVDCTKEQDLCGKHEVRGYPTIKYYKDGDKAGESYNGGRTYDALDSWVKETLERACDVNSPEGCTDKERAYITKMQGKKEKVPTELERLKGMQGASMTADKAAWLSQRVHILSGLKEEL